MLHIEPILAHVVPFVLVVCRMAGLLFVTPVLANRYLPMRFKALLAVMFSAALYPSLLSHSQIAPSADLLTLIPLIISESLIGLIMGFIASLPIVSLDLAGYIMGHQMGLGLARVYNPDMGTDTDVQGQLLMYLGLAAFVAMGGLEALFLALAGTFDRLPPGGFLMTQVPLDLIVGVLASGFELALRVSAPIVCIILLLLIAFGFVMKTMPQINILSVGFTIKIVAGLAMFAGAVAAMHQAGSGEIESVLQQVLHWTESLASAADSTDCAEPSAVGGVACTGMEALRYG